MTEIQPAIQDTFNISEIAPLVARDLAQDLYTHEEIAKTYGLTEEIVLRLLESKTFRNMLDAARAEWAAPGNAKNRATLKAQIAVEEAITHMFRIVTSEKAPDTARVAAFNSLKEVGKFEKAPQDAASTAGPGFTLTINLGPQSLTVSSPPNQVDLDAEEVQEIEG